MLEPYALKCSGMIDPIGIDMRPMFTWRLRSVERESRMTAYRIRLTDAAGAVAWDSGVCSVEAGTGVGRIEPVAYAGPALAAGTRYIWELSVADENSAWCAPHAASFMTGKLFEPWRARWIEAPVARLSGGDDCDPALLFSGKLGSSEHPEEYLNAPVRFSRRFTVGAPVARAVLFATAYGIYQVYLDGEALGEPFAPGYTVYREHLEVQTIEVTRRLSEGEHELVFVLADGWYAGKIGLVGAGNQYGDIPALLGELDITYADGSGAVVGTDTTFCCRWDGWRYADLFVGERYEEARAAHPVELGPAIERDRGFRNLCGRAAEPVRELYRITPRLLKTPAGETVLDAGTVIVGRVSFDVPCHAGQELRLEHSEVLDAAGNFQLNILGMNKNQTDAYVCDHEGRAVWEPEFTFHGFRYVRLSGFADVRAEDFTVRVLGTDLERTGSFSCTDKDLTRLAENIFRSQQGNMLSIPTDCPQRERAGWLGDLQVFAPTACFNQDMRAFLEKWLTGMRAEQAPDGQVPDVVPWIPSNKLINGDRISSAGWGDACIIVPWRLYEAYGDVSVLRDNLEMMERWMAYVARASASTPNPCIWDAGFHYGDWLVPSLREVEGPMETAERTKAPVATAMRIYSCELMARIYEVLDRGGDAVRMRAVADEIRAAFSAAFVAADGRMTPDMQGCYVLALAMRAVEGEKRAGCARRLVELIHQNGDCLDVGFLSVPFLLDVLDTCGEHELARAVLAQHKAPSWLYAVDRGATTIWENWCAIRPDGTPTDSSYNHFAFGCVGDYLYRTVGGLDLAAPGGAQLRIAPDVRMGVLGADTVRETPFGRVSVSWRIRGTCVVIDTALPPETCGTVCVGAVERAVGSGRTQVVVDFA